MRGDNIGDLFSEKHVEDEDERAKLSLGTAEVSLRKERLAQDGLAVTISSGLRALAGSQLSLICPTSLCPMTT